MFPCHSYQWTFTIIGEWHEMYNCRAEKQVLYKLKMLPSRMCLFVKFAVHPSPQSAILDCQCQTCSYLVKVLWRKPNLINLLSNPHSAAVRTQRKPCPLDICVSKYHGVNPGKEAELRPVPRFTETSIQLTVTGSHSDAWSVSATPVLPVKQGHAYVGHLVFFVRSAEQVVV